MHTLLSYFSLLNPPWLCRHWIHNDREIAQSGQWHRMVVAKSEYSKCYIGRVEDLAEIVSVSYKFLSQIAVNQWNKM